MSWKASVYHAACTPWLWQAGQRPAGSAQVP